MLSGPITTTILSIPLVQMAAITGNNEDWVDSIMYMVAPTPPAIEPTDQLDLRGIEFEMEVRRAPKDHEVVLTISTANHRMSVGASPNYGYLLIHVPVAVMKVMASGEYVADVVARDAYYTRVIIQITSLMIVEGITK